MALTLDGTNGIVSSGSITTQSSSGVIFSDSSALTAASSPYVLKNRIINGAMVIDQRNAGASITPLNTAYTVDRWVFYSSLSSKFTIQQNAGGVTPPTGFTNYVGATVASAVGSLSAADYFQFMQKIEGYNISDLAWGTANAKTITISFWARSSQTGTFSAALSNSTSNRSYVFTYTVSSSNTWEQKTITIPGDTTGTWLTTNGAGINLVFNLGYGSTYQTASPNTWLAGEYYQSSGSVTLVNTAGATFYITGVQLEVGSTATPFERRLYGTELALCQRYYYRAAVGGLIVMTGAPAANQVDAQIFFPVTMRTSSTLDTNITAGTAGNPPGSNIAAYQTGYKALSGATVFAANAISPVCFNAYTTFFTITTGVACELIFGPTAYMGFSAEL